MQVEPIVAFQGEHRSQGVFASARGVAEVERRLGNEVAQPEVVFD